MTEQKEMSNSTLLTKVNKKLGEYIGELAKEGQIDSNQLKEVIKLFAASPNLPKVDNTIDMSMFYIYTLVGSISGKYNTDFDFGQADDTIGFGFNEFNTNDGGGILNIITSTVFNNNIEPNLNTQIRTSSFATITPETFNTYFWKDVKYVGSKLLGLEVEVDEFYYVREYIEKESQQTSLFNIKKHVDPAMSILTALYKTAYQMDEPVGIITTEGTVVGIDRRPGSNEGKFLHNLSFASGLVGLSDGIVAIGAKENVEVDLHNRNFDAKALVEASENDRTIYLPRKQLEYLFGVQIKKNSIVNDNYGPRIHDTWSKMEKEIRADVEFLYHRVVKRVIEQYLPEVDPNKPITPQLRKIQQVSRVTNVNIKFDNVAETVNRSLGTSYIVTKLANTWDEPGEIVINMSMPVKAKVPVKDVTEVIFSNYSGKSGVALSTAEDKVKFNTPIPLIKTEVSGLMPYRINHVFNNQLANAVPRFAIEAANYIVHKLGKKITWNDLLVGFDTKGNLVQGQNEVQFMSTVLHWLMATSRAGKGVQSFNIIQSAQQEYIITNYADRKPDTSKIMLKHSNYSMVAVNGNFWNDLGDFKGFDWQVAKQEALKPKWFNKLESIEKLSDFIYLRMLLVDTAFKYLITSTNYGFDKVAKMIGFNGPNMPTGSFLILDEFTNFHESFLANLNPGKNGSYLNGAATPMALESIDEILEVEAEGKKLKADLGKMKKMLNLDGVYKLVIALGLNTFNKEASSWDKAGLANNTRLVDILIIGQGMKFAIKGGINTPFAYRPKETEWDRMTERGREVITDALVSITKADYILGAPGPSTNKIDILGANKGTRAADYLNDKYRGFSYIKAENVIEKNNELIGSPDDAFFFKPFLILNEMNEDEEIATATTKEEVIGRSSSPSVKSGNKTYWAQLAKAISETGIPWQDARKSIIRATNIDKEATKPNPAIGYNDYVDTISEPAETQKKYDITVDYMDPFVKALGYKGTYKEFLVDTNPEWFVTLPDFFNAFKMADTEGISIQEAFSKRATLEPLRVYLKSQIGADDIRKIKDIEMLGLDLTEEDDDEEDDYNISPTEGLGGTEYTSIWGSDDEYEDDEYNPVDDEESTQNNHDFLGTGENLGTISFEAPNGVLDTPKVVMDANFDNIAGITKVTEAELNGQTILPTVEQTEVRPETGIPNITDFLDEGYEREDEEYGYEDELYEYDDDEIYEGTQLTEEEVASIPELEVVEPGTIPAYSTESVLNPDIIVSTLHEKMEKAKVKEDKQPVSKEEKIQKVINEVDNGLSEAEVRSILDKAIKIGKQDVESSNLLYNGVAIHKLSEANPGLDVHTWYQDSYRDTYNTRYDNTLLNNKLQTKLPGAKETRELLGIKANREELDVPVINQVEELKALEAELAKTEAKPFGLDIIRKIPIPFKSARYKNSIKEEEQMIKDSLGYYSEEAIKTYGTNDYYVHNGEIVKVKNLDSVIDVTYNESDTTMGQEINVIEYMRQVTVQIINKMAGRTMIKSIHVANQGRMIVNNTININFIIPKEEYDKLPLLIKNVIDTKNWGQLFMWNELRNLPNLRSITFESYDFVLDYVKEGLAPNQYTLRQDTFLKELKQLNSVTISGETLTREEYMNDKYIGSNNMKMTLKERFNVLQPSQQNLTPEEIEEKLMIKEQKQQKRRKQVDRGLDATGQYANSGFDKSKDLTKNAFKQPGFKKLLGVPALMLMGVAGTGLVIYKAADWGNTKSKK